MSDKSIKRNLSIYINDKQVKNNLKSIRGEMRKLRSEISLATRGTKEYEEKTKELQRVKKIYRDMRKEIEGVPGIFQRMTKSAGGFMAVLGAGFGITTLIGKLKDLTTINARLSDAQADVAKTTGMSAKEVEILTDKLKKLDTRTPIMGLMGIAEEAGRLGKKSVRDVMEFVKTADKIAVALGDDLQGDINENVRLIGKLVGIYKVGADEGKSFGEGMEMVGSAINAVSASGSENAGYLVDFMKRMAGVGQATNMTADEIIGFAAVLDENGQSVEVSGTSMNKIIIDMFTNTEKYAEVAGMAVSDFTDLLNKDANEATIKFLEGIGKDNAGLQKMAGHFDQLGIDGTRAITVLTTLAKNTDTVREKQALANKELHAATSLTQEFNQKNNNLAGNLEKLGKFFTNFFINNSIKNSIGGIVSTLTDFLIKTEKLSDAINQERVELFRLESQVMNTNTSQSDRIKLIKEFQEKYPGYLKNIDAEKVTNEELSVAIKQVNEQLLNKYLLQKKQEEFDKLKEKNSDFTNLKAEAIANAEMYLAELKAKYSKFNIKEIEGTAVEQLRHFQSEMNKQISKPWEWGMDNKDISTLIFKVEQYSKKAQAEAELIAEAAKAKDAYARALGIDTNTSGSKSASGVTDNTATEDKVVKDKKIKNEKDYQAELTRIQRQAIDARLDLMDEGYEKEKAKLDELYARKIANAEKQKATDKEIAGASPKQQKILLQKNKELDDLILSYKQIHVKKLQALNEKYYKKQIEDEQKAFEQKIKILRTEQNEKLASIKTITDARKYLSDEELKGVKTVAEAKRRAQEKFNKEEEQMQMQHLRELIAESKKLLGDNELQLVNLTEEQKEAIKARLIELQLELSKLKVDLHANPDGEETDTGLGAAGDLDILGFTADQWDEAFSNLETTQQKIKATEMVVQGLMNAWKMYADFQRANDERELQQYEKSLDKKKKKLKQQLDAGYLTEAQYKRKLEKLDADLDKKKAELVYKQAKREKEMNLFNAITNTALGVAKALTAPFPINMWLPWVVGALGAAQVAMIASTPLPSKGYADGGYTTGLGYADDTGYEVAGVVHAGEYVVPEFVMSDPTVPAIIQYLEAKRTGGSYAEGGEVTEPEPADDTQPNELTMLNATVNRLAEVLERGIEAKVFFGNEEAYNVNELIKENERLKSDAKY